MCFFLTAYAHKILFYGHPWALDYCRYARCSVSASVCARFFHFGDTFCPAPTGGPRGARSSQPLRTSYCHRVTPVPTSHWRTARCLFFAASVHVCLSHGHLCVLVYWRTLRCPFFVAYAHVLKSQGHPGDGRRFLGTVFAPMIVFIQVFTGRD